MSDLRLVGNCGGRVRWIGEDEHGNVAAVGAVACVFSRTSLLAESRQYEFDPIELFVDNYLVTLAQLDKETEVRFPHDQRVVLPEATTSVISSAFDSWGRVLYLVTCRSIIGVSLTLNASRLLAINTKNDDMHPRYERIIVKHGLVVAFRYGLSIWADGEHHVRDTRSYSDVTILAPDRFLAVEAKSDRGEGVGVAHTCNAKGDVLNEVTCPAADYVCFVCAVSTIPIAVWTVHGSLVGGIVRENGITEVPLNRSGAEGFAVIESEKCIAIGTIDGRILIWNVITNAVNKVTLYESERIVSMYWSDKRRVLFIGTRHGNVYACSPV